jgi:hypothetical protein
MPDPIETAGLGIEELRGGIYDSTASYKERLRISKPEERIHPETLSAISSERRKEAIREPSRTPIPDLDLTGM